MKKYLYVSILLVVFIALVITLIWVRSAKKYDRQHALISNIPVHVDTVRYRSLARSLSLVGVIHPNNVVDIIPEAKGMVKQLHFDVGQVVREGQLLLELDDIVKKSDLARAEINYFKSKRDFERNQTLYVQNSIAAAQLDLSRLDMQSAENDLTMAQKALADTKIHAPISGIIDTRKVSEGSFVQLNTAIGTIVDISTLKVLTDVSEKDAFLLRTGDTVSVFTDVYPDQEFRGVVYFIAANADESHTYKVEIRLANSPKYPLKGGMFARVRFLSVGPRDALAIPRRALTGSIRDAKVFLIQEHAAVLKGITIGRESDDYLEVLNGLHAGDLVVISGQDNLSENSPVMIVN